MTVYDGETFIPDERNRFIIEVRMGEREKDFVEKHAKDREMTNDQVIRHAIRVFQLMEVTPGAWDAVNKILTERAGPKFVRAESETP